MTLGGLFSGIGGFELAATWAGITPVWSNEIDPFCCQVLRKNFSHEIIEGDIRDCGTGRTYELRPVDIICGGFPCQPFSTAGQRKGKSDNRFLWPEMLRTISEVKPRWIIGENVTGITSMDDGLVFDQICASLEDEGYTVEAYNIPACSVGAPHRRERIWIVAHANDILQRRQAERRELPGEAKATEGTEQREGWNELFRERSRAVFGDGFENCFSPDTTCADDRRYFGEQDCRSTQQSGNNSFQGVATHADGFRDETILPDERPVPVRGNWETHWFPAASLLCRVDDGISSGLDGAERIPGKSKTEKKKTKAGRTHRLKALGNAIVPQVALMIFNGILQFENFK